MKYQFEEVSKTVLPQKPLAELCAKLRPALYLLLLIVFSVLPSTAAECTFTVKGVLKVDVDNKLPLLHGPQSQDPLIPLSGVQVKVSARRQAPDGNGGIFAEWGTIPTDFSGQYQVSQQRQCGTTHEFRVEVKFDSRELHIASGPEGSQWYKVAEDRHADHTGVGTDADTQPALVFSANGDEELNHPTPRSHAELWVLGSLLRKTLDNLDSGFGDAPLKIHYPAGSLFALADVDPLTNVVHLHGAPKDDDVLGGNGEGDVMRGGMIAWAYLHTKPLRGGEFQSSQSIPTAHKDRHELSGSAYINGFAEFAEEKLLETIFGQRAELPLSRPALSCVPTNLSSLDAVEHDRVGWRSTLLLLTTPHLQNFDLGPPPPGRTPCSQASPIAPVNPPPAGCTDTFVSFAKILATFDQHPNLGFPHKLALDDMKLDEYMERVMKVEGGFLADKASAYLALVDPLGATQPRDTLCRTVSRR